MDYTEAFNTGSIQLEPRLQEYLRRKTFNRENDITPGIPVEQEFGVTKEDIKLISDDIDIQKYLLHITYIDMSIIKKKIKII